MIHFRNFAQVRLVTIYIFLLRNPRWYPTWRIIYIDVYYSYYLISLYKRVNNSIVRTYTCIGLNLIHLRDIVFIS